MPPESEPQGTSPETTDAEYLVDDSIPELEETATTADESASSFPGSPSPDPYAERFDRLERENGELRSSLQRFIGGQQSGQQGGPPAAFQKPREQWNVNDLFEANQYMMQHQLSQLSAEHATRGRLSAEILGQGNDYDAVVNKYVAPLAQRNPEIAPFLQQLPPEDRYMLGLLHEIHQRAGGDLVKTIRAVRNALGARQEGARDVTRGINTAARQTALKVFQGGGGRQTGRRALNSDDIWNMSDEEFRRLSNRSAGR